MLFYFVVVDFFSKKDVIFAMPEVLVLASFAAPRETCVSALRFLFAEVSGFFPVGAAGGSSARMD